MYAEEGTTPPEGGYQVLTFKRRKGKEVHRESTRWPCPHCEHLCTIRTSNMLTRTMRETTYICSNPECACSFVVNSQIDRMLSVGPRRTRRSTSPCPAMCAAMWCAPCWITPTPLRTSRATRSL